MSTIHTKVNRRRIGLIKRTWISFHGRVPGAPGRFHRLSDAPRARTPLDARHRRRKQQKASRKANRRR